MKTAEPLVSVIIPTYNRLDYIGQAIESVLKQTYTHYEILVVDDGSTIDVKKVLEPYLGNIAYIYQKNEGLGSARNTGITHSKGKYLAFLDDDDLFEPRKLEVQVRILEKYPEIGLVYSDGYVFDTTNPSDIRLNPAVARDAPNSEFTKLFFMNTNIYVSAFLTRRQCFEDVGLFDESIPPHADSDIILRIALEWPIKFSDYPSTKIRYHPVQMSLDRIAMNTCILKSNYKIFRLYPDFKAALGEGGDKKMAELHYSLAQSYIRRENFPEARKELDAYISTCPKPFWKAQIYRYILRFPKPVLIFRAIFYVSSFYRRVVIILQNSII